MTGRGPSYHGEVLAAAGITYRQLDYWCRIGLLGVEHQGRPGSGSRRTFSSEDVRVLTALGRVGVLVTQSQRATEWRVRVAEAVRRGDTTVEIIPGVTIDLTVVAPPLEAAS